MIAGTPLVVAALFGAGADTVGLIVAIQSSAWLLISLPAGLMVDRVAPLDALSRAMGLAFAGISTALAGLWLELLPIFAFGAFLSAAATVVATLAEGAGVQQLLPAGQLLHANARLQITQSLSMLLGPAVMGYCILHGLALAGYGLALLLVMMGLLNAFSFGPQPARVAGRCQPWRELADGFRFVRTQPLLLGVIACALFWNMAFFALMVVFVPFALGPIGLNVAEAGAAQAAMGIGSLAAAFVASATLSRFSPRAVLTFGPASSLLAAILLAVSPSISGMVLPLVTFLLLGFGPILWFVCQNSIRQLVTPAELLGRVGSVIQVAIYGVRSVGALLGGFVAVHAGFEAALMMVVLLFAISTVCVLASALGGLRALPDPINTV